MSFKFCPECGFKFDREYKFCPECGFKLSEGEKKSEPLFDFSVDTAKYADDSFGGFDKQLKEQKEATKKTGQLTSAELKEIETAKKLYFAEKYKEALPVLKKYAEKGNAEAQFYYAGVLQFEFEDVKQAIYWLRMAVEQGNTDAMTLLAQYYTEGIGVPEDKEKARYWLQKAADLGDTMARAELKSLMNEMNKPAATKSDAKKPVKAAPLSAEEKELEEAERLYYDSKQQFIFPTVKQYAEKGNAKAQWLLGMCYDGQGLDTPLEDPKQAVYWYKKAVAQGNTDAMCSLGQCYNYGYGVSEDLQEARRLFQKALDLGNKTAKSLLEMMDMFDE